jgi:NAD(P)-dependent dehydrogenase (short-subunit alcohol dehydrogenase family)
MSTDKGNESARLAELISMKGRRVLITGSAAGIGKAMAFRFAEAGADLDLVDIDKDKLTPLKEELEKRGADVAVHRVDLSKKDEIDSLWESLSKVPDTLVNNAGIYPFVKFLEVDEARLSKVMDVNVMAVFWMCQNMIRKRLKDGGVIINVGTIEAILPFKADMAHYDMSKAGVIGLTRALARDYGGKHFKINCIIPGWVNTPGTKSAAKTVLTSNVGLIRTGIEFWGRLPMKRLGEPDDIAKVAIFLASGLSSYVQGALIVADGGFLSA